MGNNVQGAIKASNVEIIRKTKEILMTLQTPILSSKCPNTKEPIAAKIFNTIPNTKTSFIEKPKVPIA